MDEQGGVTALSRARGSDGKVLGLGPGANLGGCLLWVMIVSDICHHGELSCKHTVLRTLTRLFAEAGLMARGGWMARVEAEPGGAAEGGRLIIVSIVDVTSTSVETTRVP